LQAVFEKDGREIGRAERDYGEVKPGEQRVIMLESLSLLPPGDRPELPARSRYGL